jgi:oxygen-independent coproporphyrinogen-3 oxidase
MQSANSSTLRALGRRHSVEQVGQVVDWAKSAQLKVSLDLIYGCPQVVNEPMSKLTPKLAPKTGIDETAANPQPKIGSNFRPETLADWARSLTSAINFSPDHISCYALTLEPTVPLYRNFHPDPDVQAEMYQLADQKLESAGFRNYEISNWAKPGFESQHNLNYWNQGNWLGFGAGAHSAVQNQRWSNPRGLSDYFKMVDHLSTAKSQPNLELLNSRQLRNEQIMLRIRTRNGILVSPAELERLTEFSELINVNPSRTSNQAQFQITLNPRGRFLADSVIRELIEI